MFRIILTFTLILTVWEVRICAQTPRFTVEYQDSSWYGIEMTQASDSNYYLGGDKSYGVNITKFVLLRTNQEGHILWRRDVVIDSTWVTKVCLAPDNHGGLFVALRLFNYYASLDYSVVMRLDSTGALLWLNRVHIQGGGWFLVQDIARTADGGIVMCGGATDMASPFAMGIAKMDTAGQILWNRYLRTTDGQQCCAREVDVTPAGDIYVTGDNYGNAMHISCLVGLLDNSGNIIWAKQFEFGYGESPNLTAWSAHDSCLVIGGWEFPSNLHGFLYKVDQNANVVWSRKYNGTYGCPSFNEMMVSWQNKIYITDYRGASSTQGQGYAMLVVDSMGQFQDAVTWDTLVVAGAQCIMETANKSIALYGFNRYNPSSSPYVKPLFTVLDYFADSPCNEIHYSYTSDTLSPPLIYDLIEDTMQVQTIEHANSVVIDWPTPELYFCQDTVPDFMLSVSEQQVRSSITVHPNPGNGLFTISMSQNGKHEIRIYDCFGNLLESSSTTQQQSSIDLRGYADGIYFVKITNGENSCTEKVVIAR